MLLDSCLEVERYQNNGKYPTHIWIAKHKILIRNNNYYWQQCFISSVSQANQLQIGYCVRKNWEALKLPHSVRIPGVRGTRKNLFGIMFQVQCSLFFYCILLTRVNSYRELPPTLSVASSPTRSGTCLHARSHGIFHTCSKGKEISVLWQVGMQLLCGA